jgi:hypothetical protein
MERINWHFGLTRLFNGRAGLPLFGFAIAGQRTAAGAQDGTGVRRRHRSIPPMLERIPD